MKLIWLSDLHFEFLNGNDARAFITGVAAEKPVAVLITGDISDAQRRNSKECAVQGSNH